MDNSQPQLKLSKVWKQPKKDYKLISMIGQGSFGTVIKAQNRATRKYVAIKLLEGFNKTQYSARKVLREVEVLSKMSEMDSNIFTSKLIDVIIPEGDEEVDHLFIVMPLGTMDLKSFLESSSVEAMKEEHLVTFLYNLLCSMSYLHSMDVIHRDIKPANILIDEQCGVSICDFGLARSVPKQSEVEIDIEIQRSRGQKLLQSNTGKDRASRLSEFKDSISKTLRKNEAELSKQDRSRTCGVYSRFYRAPEVITLHKQYGKAADIWAMGCVLLDFMLAFQKKPRYLFRGKQCFPISPPGNSNDKVSNDQLVKILERFPDLNSETDFSYANDEDSIDYLSSNMDNCDKKKESMRSKLAGCNPQLIQIVTDMLQFNPYFRPSAYELLQNPIFDKIKLDSNEHDKQCPINIDFDAGKQSYNYEKDLEGTPIDMRAVLNRIKLTNANRK